jgi:hypothetical protein
MAKTDITTNTRPAFTWLFLATYADPKALPVTLRTQADTEEAAREHLAGDYTLTFAAKIRTDCPITCHWMERDKAVLWSVIGTSHNLPEYRQFFTELNQEAHHAH